MKNTSHSSAEWEKGVVVSKRGDIMTELEVYSQLDCRSIEEVVNSNLQIVDKKFGEIATLFVENGYCLRRQLDEKMYEAAGYQTFEDYIKDVYGRSRSWAKRMMQINEKFSIGGNHPRIDEKYIGYSVSQLQEMLYLTDEQMEDVSPDMTVKEIREVRKPEEKITPIQRGCITGKNPNGTCACCGNEGTVDCCAQCPEDCNVRCGWLDKKESCATSHDEKSEEVDEIPGQMHVEDYPELLPKTKEEETGCPPNQSSCARVNWGSSSKEQEAGRKECKKCWDEYKQRQKILNEAERLKETEEDEIQEVTEPAEVQQASNQDEVILEGEYKELPEEKYEETTEKSDMELLKEMLDKEKYMLDALLKEYTDQDIRVRKAKIKVGALASMLFELEMKEDDELEEIEDTEQPELPVLRNNDQRKAFLENYKTWPVWFEVPEASEIYYRYSLPDGSSLVICEYKYYLEWKIKYLEGDPETTNTREYLLKPGYHYLHDCRANTSMLVEHLKNVLKGEK